MDKFVIEGGAPLHGSIATSGSKNSALPALAAALLTADPVVFDRISVTGTEDILMAAVLADGETVIENAAREPEVVDLAQLLRKMGAKIEGEGSSVIRVEGVSSLHGATHGIIADRIEAGTFVIAGVITGGDLKVTGCVPEHLGALTAKLTDAGARISVTDETTVHVAASHGAIGP